MDLLQPVVETRVKAVAETEMKMATQRQSAGDGRSQESKKETMRLRYLEDAEDADVSGEE